MKILAASWSLIVVALALVGGDQPPPTAPEAIDLILPGKHQRLRLQLTTDGQSCATAWNSFLDQWLDWFDRDGDGVLSQGEAARMFPLPLPDQRTIPFDFAQADANKDGKVGRAELKAYYARAGFTPLITKALPTSLKDLQISEALFRHFASGADGKLTAARLKAIGTLLRKLDENEDGILTAAEVVSLGVDARLKTAPASECQWAPTDSKAVLDTIALHLANVKGRSLSANLPGNQLEMLASEKVAAFRRIRFGNIMLVFSPSLEDPIKSAAVTRQFGISQFNIVAGSKKWLQKRHVEDDASLQLVADLFAHADRDSDGNLTLTELEQFLSLIELGIGCSTVMTLHEAGRNLFELLDANGDGRLDASELHAAAALLGDKGAAQGWLKSDVPLCIRITAQRGISAASFGPVPLITLPAAAPAQSPERNTKGPAWFRAMDRNSDGLVSAVEFLGPTELFRLLDRNGDGVITVEEVDRAGKDPTARPN